MFLFGPKHFQTFIFGISVGMRDGYGIVALGIVALVWFGLFTCLCCCHVVHCLGILGTDRQDGLNMVVNISPDFLFLLFLVSAVNSRKRIRCTMTISPTEEGWRQAKQTVCAKLCLPWLVCVAWPARFLDSPSPQTISFSCLWGRVYGVNRLRQTLLWQTLHLPPPNTCSWLPCAMHACPPTCSHLDRRTEEQTGMAAAWDSSPKQHAQCLGQSCTNTLFPPLPLNSPTPSTITYPSLPCPSPSFYPSLLLPATFSLSLSYDILHV